MNSIIKPGENEANELEQIEGTRVVQQPAKFIIVLMLILKISQTIYQIIEKMASYKKQDPGVKTMEIDLLQRRKRKRLGHSTLSRLS